MELENTALPYTGLSLLVWAHLYLLGISWLEFAAKVLQYHLCYGNTPSQELLPGQD